MIRLQRVGRKNDPSFRIVVMPKQKDSQSGKTVEVLGSYNARQGRPQIKAERVKHWIAMGAQVSGTVRNLLIDQKIIDGKKVNVLPKRKPVEKKEESAPVAEAPVAESAETPEQKEAETETVAETPIAEPEAAPAPVDETPASV